MKQILPRTPVTLTANEPEKIWIKDGIDISSAEIYFRYPPFNKTQTIMVKFGDASGKSAQQPVQLPVDGSRNYHMDLGINQLNISPYFAYIELTSYSDMTLEVSAEEGEAMFH